MLGELETLTPLLVLAAEGGELDPNEYLRWRGLVECKHLGEASEGAVSFGVMPSSKAVGACLQALEVAMRKRYPQDSRVLSESEQDFVIIP